MTDTTAIRVALYARVSTSNHGRDVTLQTRELSLHTEAGSSPENMWTREFPDRKSAGQNSPTYGGCAPTSIEAVSVWEFDRFARSG